MAKRNAKIFTWRFTMFLLQITPKPVCWWWTRNARRERGTRGTMFLFLSQRLRMRFGVAEEVAEEEGSAWLIPWINNWSAGFPPEWWMQARPDAFERLKNRKGPASACAGRFCWRWRSAECC